MTNTMPERFDRKSYMKEWRNKNKEHIREYNKVYIRDKTRTREIWNKFYQKNKARRLTQYKKYYFENKEKIFERYRENYRKKVFTPEEKIYKNIRYQFWRMLKSEKGKSKWESFVGYSRKDLLNHLEKQFDDKMNWNNYGSYWHIDHIKPVSLFKFTSMEDESVKQCWSLSNLQPLEAIANIRKSNKYTEPQII